MNLEIKVERAEGHKCPRCWKYHGIPTNYQGICDLCARAILESTADDYIENRRPDQTEDDFRAGFVAMQESIRAAYRDQQIQFSCAAV
jgi:hypothetical protein